MRRLLLALVLLLTAPAAAHAAPPWSEPVPVDGSVGSPPLLAFAPSGDGLVAGRAPGRTGAFTAGAAQREDGTFGSVRELSEEPLIDLAGLARDRLVGIGASETDPPRAATFSGEAGSGRLSRTAAGLGVPVDLAIGPRGDAAVLLARCASSRCNRVVPSLAFRSGRSASFGRPVRLGASQVRFSGAVAVDRSGRVLVAWERGRDGRFGPRTVFARRGTVGGRLGAVRRLGGATPSVRVQAALGADGTGVVAWFGQSQAEGGTAGPLRAAVAVAPPRRSFGTVQRLENKKTAGEGVGGAGVVLVAPASGRPVLAWTGRAVDRFAIRVARVGVRRVGRPQIFSHPTLDTVVADVAADARGGAVVTALRGGGPTAVVATASPSGATGFGPLESVGTPGRSVFSAEVAFDPDDRRAVTAWSDGYQVVTASRDPLP